MQIFIGDGQASNLTVFNSTTAYFIAPTLNQTGYRDMYLWLNNMTLTFTDVFYYTSDCPEPGTLSLSLSLSLPPLCVCVCVSFSGFAFRFV